MASKWRAKVFVKEISTDRRSAISDKEFLEIAKKYFSETFSNSFTYKS